MADTLTLTRGIAGDTPSAYRLKRSAVDRYKADHGLANDDEFCAALDLARATFYRMLRREGKSATGVCACRAQAFADRLGYTVEDAFEVSA